jgi:biopolymer transport protein ExbB
MTLIRTLALTGGDWVVYGLLLCSVIAVAAIIERALLLKREGEDFAAFRAAVAGSEGDLDAVEKAALKHTGAAAKIIGAAVSQAQHGAAGVEDLMAAASIQERQRLEQRLLVLGTLGANAPFVGLFGTVLGVIKAFHDLSEAGAGPEVVMQGLSEALIATAVGLFVAIPCVVAYNYFQKQVKELLNGTDALGRLVLAHVRSGKTSRK